jgi:exonuclease III
MLRIGSTGPRVLALEQKLKATGDLKGRADATFDQKTGAAVKAWKAEHGWEDPKPRVGGKMAAMLNLPKPGQTGTETPKTMRGATYNCRIGRNPQVVKQVVSDFLKNRKLDFMQVQEISGYDQVLSKIPGYKLITFRGSKDHGETGVLVRDSIMTREPRSIEAATGWTNVHHRPAQPRAATSVQLAGWLRVVSVHAPPGIDWVNGVPRGGPDRIKSYQSLTQRLLGHARRSKDAVLIGGDWNEGARTGGPGSPSWLAARAGLKKHANGRIDWEMTRGAKLTNMHVGRDGGSDHRIVAFTITRPG